MLALDLEGLLELMVEPGGICGAGGCSYFVVTIEDACEFAFCDVQI